MGGIIVLGLIALLAALVYKMISENEATHNHRLLKSNYGIKPLTQAPLFIEEPMNNTSAQPAVHAKYCSACGARLDSKAVFCSFCGIKLADAGVVIPNPAAPVSEVKREVFNWGRFTSNESALNEVNQWLSGQRIIVLEMSTTGRLKEFPPNQTIINHLDLKYRESANGSYYQMWYFSKRKWIGHDYSALDEMLENWKASNPDKTVVLKTYNGFQDNGSGGCRTLFFLYRLNNGY